MEDYVSKIVSNTNMYSDAVFDDWKKGDVDKLRADAIMLEIYAKELVDNTWYSKEDK